jgi:hypothetical protein
MSATRSRSRRTVPGAAALLVFALLSAAGLEGLCAAASERDGRLGALRDAIDTAFRQCDVAPLHGAFSRRVKTCLASRALGIRRGYYGADQSLLILRRGFAGRSTLRFRLESLDDAPPQSGRRVVTARWVYRDEGASKSATRLAFTLARDGHIWSIREIREMK